MNQTKDISFDIAGALIDLRKETKAWATTFLRSAEAIRAMLGKVKTTVKTVEKQAKRTVAGFDKLTRLDGPDTTVTTTVTKEEGAMETIRNAFSGLIENVKNAFGSLWEKGKEILGSLTGGFGGIQAGISAVVSLLKGDKSVATWLGLFSSGVSATGNKLGVLSGILTNLKAAFSGVGSTAGRVWNGINALWGGVSLLVSDKLVTPVGIGIKSVVNLLITLVNAGLTAVVTAANALSETLNAFSVKIPPWVPVLGGKTLGFQLPVFSVPTIPYLAQGAVLPANKPFMAMVGDQKHGTNIEAPLTTIQEAVASVMGDQATAMMAGFETLAAQQREILGAILNIEIGDDVIGNAAARYNHRIAIRRGG